ncbi:MAG: SRPBCC family protein [Thaumarchaeota archaeon]|nr:SRPBCC family protein [Nitrososphaerota archaeon]
MHLEAAVTVRARRDRVYAAYTDFESMPKWAKMEGTVSVTRKEGDVVYLESVRESDRGSRIAKRSLKLTDPSSVESESETRFTRTKRTVAFEEVPEGTRVTARLEVEVKGLWAKLLATREGDEFEPGIQEELESFARYAESLT